MTTQFDTLHGAYAAPALLVMYGESVTYRPAAGGTRAITAIVTTDAASIAGLVEDVSQVKCVIKVLNNATTGIASSELNCGGDKIDAVLRNGDTADTLAIKLLVNDDAGWTIVAAY
jgi:hypothetical protein